MTNLEIARRAAARHWPADTDTYRRITGGKWDDTGIIATAVAALEMRDSMAAELAGALRELLADTQHSRHNCGDADCPVDLARAALAKWEAGK